MYLKLAFMQGDEVKLTYPPRIQDLGAEVSPYATHFMFLDDKTKSSAAEAFSSLEQKHNVRHFNYRMLDAMENCKRGRERLSVRVCVFLS
jgi:hypothetical protein